MEPDDPSRPEALPRIYASWRCRTLIGVLIASAVGLFGTGPMGELRIDLDGEMPSVWLLLGLAGLVAGSFGPGLVGTGLALAAIGSWRRLRRSSRYTRLAWILWVLGPLPVLLLPMANLFDLDEEDAARGPPPRRSAISSRSLPRPCSPCSLGSCDRAWSWNASSPSPGPRPDHNAGGSGMHGCLPFPGGGPGPTGVPVGNVPGPAAHRRFAPRATAGGPPTPPAQSAGPGGSTCADHRLNSGRPRRRRGASGRPLVGRAYASSGP